MADLDGWFLLRVDLNTRFITAILQCRKNYVLRQIVLFLGPQIWAVVASLRGLRYLYCRKWLGRDECLVNMEIMSSNEC